MHEKWPEWVERGRAVMGAPPLSRRDKSVRGLEDPKWILGDFLLEVPAQLIDSLAQHLGTEKNVFQRAREVASKWPPERRVAASWSAHRDLKDHDERFQLIRPGMSVREAAEAAGKKAIDAKPHDRMSEEEKAAAAITLLTDKRVNELVLAHFAQHRERRRMEAAARAALDWRSAEYKEARRRLTEAQAVKSPDLAFLEVSFKFQEHAEYLAAVVDAATDPVAPYLPDHRKPDLRRAIEKLKKAAEAALEVLGEEESSGENRTAGLLESTNEVRL